MSKKAEKNSPLSNAHIVLKAWRTGHVTKAEMFERIAQERFRCQVNALLYDVGPYQTPVLEPRPFTKEEICGIFSKCHYAWCRTPQSTL